MGLPHKESQQLFTEMSLSFKKDIKSKLLNVASNLGMNEIIFTSFVRKYGYKCAISASDAVYGISALLDCGAEWMRRRVCGGGSGLEGSGGGVGADEVKSLQSRRVEFDTGGGGSGGGGAGGVGVSAATMTGVGFGTRLGAAAVGVRLSDFDVDGGGRGGGGRRASGVVIANAGGSSTQVHAGDQAGGVVDEGDGDPEYEPPVADEDEEAAMAREERNRRRAKRREWVKNFYVAYDALDNIDLLYHGIHLSMHFQKVLVRTGMSIIEKSATKHLQKFKFTVLMGGGGGRIGSGGMVGENDSSMFGKSVPMLRRLACFLIEAFRENKRGNVPLVVAAYNEVSDSYLVVGMRGSSRTGDVTKNKFGIAFQKATEITGAKVKHDHFDTSVAEVPREDLVDFLDKIGISL
ncbi:hypothetical protein HDU76_009776 [Blyttiomyces sp. JEL0837]|nr:hypothetical protein HDU76_009776 [Blyttiomyces sp. JEL0837]